MQDLAVANNEGARAHRVHVVCGLGLPDDERQLALNRLNQLVDEFRAIVVAVRGLPASTVTRRVATMLDQAADEEDLALRNLRGSFEVAEFPSGPAVGAVSDAPADSTADEAADGTDAEEVAEEPLSEPEEQNADEDETIFVQSDRSLFGAFDTRLVASNALRRDASRALTDLAEDASNASRAAVADFTGEYAALVRSWDAFHGDYDAWRASDGGCDRTAVVASLGGFLRQFGELATGVRSLPRSVLFQPMGELFVEAAEREERALKELRNGWRPFDPAVYRDLDQERVEARQLRRQATTGLNDLLPRYGITPEDVEQATPSAR